MAWTDPATYTLNEIVTYTKLNTHIRDNMKELWHEVAYVEFTADVTTTTATEAAPLDVVSAGAITFSAFPIIVEFDCPRLELPQATTTGISLWDGTTDLGRLAYGNATTGVVAPVFRTRRLTPTAASHTYKIRIWTAGATTAAARAGAGGAGVLMPGYIRIMQKGS